MAKILLIDDEALIRDRMKKLLTLDDYEAFTAEDGKKGLEVFKKEKPDIVLLDIKMPGIDGIEVLKKIREQPEKTEIIMITGHGGVETAVEAIRAGAFGYIQKPVEYDELIIEIKRALEKQEMQRKLNEHVKNLELANAELEGLYEQLQREHEIATQVFAKVVRTSHINTKNVKYLLYPMDIVGGDLILTAAGPSGSQYIFLGDFTGHGLSAAIGAISVSDIFYTMVGKGHPIVKIVIEINRKLKNVLPSGLFLCACFMELDYTHDRLNVWNGGIPDALIVSKEDGVKKRFSSTHLPLGVIGNEKLDTGMEVVELAHGDLIYIYSDGVIEASNKDGEMFGQERLEEILTNVGNPETIFDEISGSHEAFRSGVVQQDDIALVEIRYDSEAAVTGFSVKTVGKPTEGSSRWKLALEVGPESLRKNELIPNVMEMLMDAHDGLVDHKGDIYLILSELITNSLDYGLLCLDSRLKREPESFEEYHATREKMLAELEDGSIKIDLELILQDQGGKLLVGVEDTGPGFDFEKVMAQPVDETALGGRGIQLVRSVCEEFAYLESGNCVETIYAWQ